MRALAESMRKKACAATLVALAVLGIVLCIGLCGAQQAWADGGDAAAGGGAASAVDLGAPERSKVLTPNGDGTYNLTLSVTGKSQASSEKTKANVVVVLDTSGSMGETVVSYTYVEAGPDSQGSRYGLVDGKYVRLSWRDKEEGWFYRQGHTYKRYEGTVYVRETTSVQRVKAAKDAANALAEDLLALNGEGENNIQMALVEFNNSADVKKASSDSCWFTDLGSFKSQIGSLSANYNTGTNWEDALLKANSITGDGDPTYVVFVSDGNPTFYNRGGTGYEYDDNVATCYKAARDDAKAIVDAKKSFYAIGAFGDVSRMQSLVNYAYTGFDSGAAPVGHYFNATDHEGLENAFSAIVDDIEKNYTYTDVAISDKMSNLAAAGVSVADGKATGFSYKQNNTEWTDAPEATFSDGIVTWKLGDNFKLVDGVTYSVTFKVQPNQKAYDTVADLTNGKLDYDAKAYPNVVKNADGSYSVYSNESATLKYKQVNVVDDVETKSEEKTASYECPLMPVPVSTLTVSKVWGTLPAVGSFVKPSVDLVVMRDGEDYKTIALNGGNAWTMDLAVPAGPDGHVYSVKEKTTMGSGWTAAPSAPVEMKSLEALSSGYGVSLTNSYSAASAKASISVQKKLEGREWKDADAFEFTLSGDSGAPMPAESTVEVSGSDPVSFGEITFNAAGTYTYKVVEKPGSIGGITYDTTPRTVKVVVTDDGEGQLSASVDYGAANLTAAVFTNVYGADEIVLDGDTALKVAKTLEGRSWREGDSFQFKLKAVTSGAPMPSSDVVTADSENAVSFGKMTFKEADTYEYEISELSGDIPGISYSDATCSVTVTVTDDGEGKLLASVSYGNNMSVASFTNTYSVTPTESSLTADGQVFLTKILEGRDLQEGEFEFQLVDLVTGKVAAKGVNAADGSVAMSSVKFETPDVYRYVLSEVQGNAENVTYDDSEYFVTARVSDNGDGTMSVAWTAGSSEDEAESSDGLSDIVFKNSYKQPEVVPPATPETPGPGVDGNDGEEPEKPAASDAKEPALAKTGDGAPYMLAGAGALAAAAAVACVFARRKLG